MIRRITKLSQVIDVLDNEKATFYYGKEEDMDEYSREVVRTMEMNLLKKMIQKGLIVRITR